MHIAILTFQGFNELDSLIALGVLNRIKKPGWRVTLCCPEPTVTSMNGVTVHAQSGLDELASAQAVIVGSGILTREVVADEKLMARLPGIVQGVVVQMTTNSVPPFTGNFTQIMSD